MASSQMITEQKINYVTTLANCTHANLQRLKLLLTALSVAEGKVQDVVRRSGQSPAQGRIGEVRGYLLHTCDGYSVVLAGVLDGYTAAGWC